MEYIEPCCVGRELLAMLKEMPVVPFQTNGNVTLEHFMKGLSEFAGNKLEITLAVPVIDIPMLRMLAWYNRRGWAKKVVIMTKEKQRELIDQELEGYGFTAVVNPEMSEGTLVMKGELKTVVIQGEILGEVAPNGCKHYTGSITNDKEILSMMLDTLTMQIRKAERDAKTAGETETPGATEQNDGDTENAESVTETPENVTEDPENVQKEAKSVRKRKK